MQACVMVPKQEDVDWLHQDVAGLGALQRNLMALCSLGQDQVIVLCPADQVESIQQRLPANDRRMPRVKVRATSQRSSLADHAYLLIDASHVYHPAWLAEALAQSEAGSIQVPDQQGIHLARVLEAEKLSSEAFDQPVVQTLSAGGYALPVVSVTQRKKAKKAIFRSLIKPTDGWFSVHLNRPISLSISKILVQGPIHPNWATLFAFAVGVLSALLSALGTYWTFALGGVCYQLASILDGVDGELARVKFLGSKTGQWLDTVCDDLTNAAYIGGVTVGIWRIDPHSDLVWVGAGAVLLNVLTIAILYYQLVVRFRSGTLLGFQWDFMQPKKRSQSFLANLLARLEPLLKRDFYGYAFMVLALIDMVWLVLPLSAVGLLGALGGYLWQVLQWRKAQSTPSRA